MRTHCCPIDGKPRLVRVVSKSEAGAGLELDPGTSWPSRNKCVWQPCWPFLHRLLKVKPEERLTIEGVLDHPWLNSTEALDNVLPSAQLMMDKVLNDAYFVSQKGCAGKECWGLTQ